MYSNFNHYPQQPQLQSQSSAPAYQRLVYQTGLKGRPVSSIEEVKASTIDFDGSIFFFPDLANKRIYTKQINMDGTSTLLMYELKDVPIQVPSEQAGNYITREEFDAAMAQLKATLIPVKEPEEAPKPQIRPEILSF